MLDTKNANLNLNPARHRSPIPTVAGIFLRMIYFAQTRNGRRCKNLPMPASEFRTKAAECGLLALDASRTETQRAESHLQQTLWLKMAHEADENEDARLLRIALRATK